MHLQNFMPAIYLHTLVQGQPWQGWFCNPGESVSKAGERGKGFMWSSEVFLKKKLCFFSFKINSWTEVSEVSVI